MVRELTDAALHREPDRPEFPESAVAANMQLVQYFSALVAERRTHPQDDMTSLLIGAEIDNEVSERADRQGQHFYDAELHRLRAETLLDMDGNAVEEALFGHALEIARRQEAKTFELRAATSLARLWQRPGKPQGKRDAARALLLPVYKWFTEGFDIRDLIEAKALIEEIR